MRCIFETDKVLNTGLSSSSGQYKNTQRGSVTCDGPTSIARGFVSWNSLITTGELTHRMQSTIRFSNGLPLPSMVNRSWASLRIMITIHTNVTTTAVGSIFIRSAAPNFLSVSACLEQIPRQRCNSERRTHMNRCVGLYQLGFNPHRHC